MKRLFILRHAQTLPSDSGGDISRKLTPEGKKDAQALGKFMAREKHRPDIVLCSPATRTRETLAGVLESLGEIPTEYLREIYNASAAELLHLLRQQSGQTVLLLGHNPGVYELTARLAGNGAPPLLDRLSHGYRPGTLSVLSCPCENWKDLAPGENTLTDLREAPNYD
ncbi:MAG TPA: phosphoglycerate mutase [Rhodospirillaceae bacterium]|nr:phosphoglycerate mutase [Rhodospirillaceae bacterium]